MTKKLQQQIKKLQREVVDLKIREHTKKYLHISFNWNSILLFLGALFLCFMVWQNFQGILYLWEILELGALEEADIKGLHQLVIIPSLFFEYLFIYFSVVGLVASFKGGISKLKSYDEVGLVGALLVGLVGGLLGGLTGVLTGGLLGGLLLGLVVGLAGGLLLGLVVGLVGEFKE